MIFGNIGNDKRTFHYPKHPIWVNNIYIDETLISNKASFGKQCCKYCIGYKDDDYEMKPFCKMHPKMSGYSKSFDETKYFSFLIKDDELLTKYDKIWHKVSNNIEKDLIANRSSMKNI